MPKQTDTSLLEMALIGYEAEREKIIAKIADINAQLDGRSRRARTSGGTNPTTSSRRRMSAAARKRIAAAQKKRWAEYRRQHKAA